MVSDFELLNRVRLTLNDKNGCFWSDSQLEDFIKIAKREYCKQVPLLFQWIPVLNLVDNTFFWDENFIKFQYGETVAGDIIQPATHKSQSIIDKALVDNGDGSYYLVGVEEGELASIFYRTGIGIDAEIDGFYSWVFQYNDNNQTVKGIDLDAKVIKAYVNSSYEFFGIENNFDIDYENSPYGIPNIQFIGKPVAYLHCQRTSFDGCWEINDVPPIVFYTCYLALLAETDRKNVEVANVCLSFFNNIVNARSNRNLSSLKTIRREKHL